jgi:hypothetical protein
MGNEYEIFENRGANRANNRVWMFNPTCRINLGDEFIQYRTQYNLNKQLPVPFLIR